MASNPKSPTQNLKSLLPLTSTSEAETRALGERLADLLPAGTVLALYGDLGTGKTRLVKGIAAGLGIAPETVQSPTFVIVREYDGTPHPLYHFDAYRVGSPDEFVELGYEDYFFGDGLCCVEWAGRVEALIPEEAVRLRLTHESPDTRRIALAEA